MAAPTATELHLTESMEDEMWKIMQMVVEMGAHHEDTVDGPQITLFEADLDDVQHDGEEDQHEREKAIRAAAAKLIKAADEMDRKMAEAAKGWIKIPDEYAGQDLGALFSGAGLKDASFQSGGLRTIYSVFYNKMENLLVGEHGFNQFALISSVTRGIAQGLRASSSHAVALSSALATKFIKDKYGSYIAKNGGLAQLLTQKEGARI